MATPLPPLVDPVSGDDHDNAIRALNTWAFAHEARIAALEAAPPPSDTLVELNITAEQEQALAKLARGQYLSLAGPTFDILLKRP